MSAQDDFLDGLSDLPRTGFRSHLSDPVSQPGERDGLYCIGDLPALQGTRVECAMFDQQQWRSRVQIGVDRIAKDPRNAHRRHGNPGEDGQVIGVDDLRRPDQKLAVMLERDRRLSADIEKRLNLRRDAFPIAASFITVRTPVGHVHDVSVNSSLFRFDENLLGL